MSSEARLPLSSLSPNSERAVSLQTLFPEAFAEGKIDFNKLKQALGGAVQTDRERNIEMIHQLQIHQSSEFETSHYKAEEELVHVS